MNDTKQKRMENPARLAELGPLETLKRAGLGEDEAVCDIGAGSGIFTVAAAQITKNKVYALEIDDNMLEVIAEKAARMGSSNIEPVKVDGDRTPLPDQAADLILMVTVLHEIENTSAFMEEAKRLLKRDGRILVIEFHKRETPMGPPVSHRMEREKVIKIMNNFGFSVAEDFDLGDNFYCIIFQ